MTDCDFPNKVTKLAHLEPNRWREVTLLAGAKPTRGSSSNISQMVEVLCFREKGEEEVPSSEDIWGAHLAGQALVETADLSKVGERNQPKLNRVRGWIVYIISRNDLPAVKRTMTGANLARIGDPRPGVTSIDQMKFSYIPIGTFWMGDEKSGYPEEKQNIEMNF